MTEEDWERFMSPDLQDNPNDFSVIDSNFR